MSSSQLRLWEVLGTFELKVSFGSLGFTVNNLSDAFFNLYAQSSLL